MSIDGFLYAGDSALDIVSREVLIYFGHKLQGNIYYSSAHAGISKSHSGNAILAHLDEPQWLKEFHNYRNTVAHELLLANLCNITLDMYDSAGPKIIIPLPNDPRAKPDKRLYTRNPDVVKYTSDSFRRLLSHINQIYSSVCDGVDRKGTLPL